MYDENMVAPMRQEMTDNGFIELKTAAEVNETMAKTPKSALLFVNSVCGCAAGIARPGIIDSLKNEVKPDVLGTAFAGNDVEGVNRMRELFVGYAPSSPCLGIFREGILLHVVERHQIEGQSLANLSNILSSLYNKFCGDEVNESAKVFDPMAELVTNVSEVKTNMAKNDDLVLLDVRENWEREQNNIDGSLQVNNELANEIVSTWKKDREIVIYCAHGNRSMQAVQFLKGQGFTNVKSMEGGIAAWS
jgi:putative YphP/YqiW family bacilliredoxin